jgi:hypothetical protein
VTSSRRRLATAKVLPVYLQEPTYLRTAGTAGQCQQRTSAAAKNRPALLHSDRPICRIVSEHVDEAIVEEPQEAE